MKKKIFLIILSLLLVTSYYFKNATFSHLHSEVPLKNIDNELLYQIAAMVYGEVGLGNEEYHKMAISAFLNSLGQNEWANMKPKQILENRFYAVKNKNNPYTWAIKKNFPNYNEENRFKKILTLTSAIIENREGKFDNQFYFTKNEIRGLKRNKRFDFRKLVSTGNVGKYYLYKYK